MKFDNWNKGLEEKRGKRGYVQTSTLDEVWYSGSMVRISWWIILDMEDFGRYSVVGWNQGSGGQNNVWPEDTETMGVHCICNCDRSIKRGQYYSGKVRRGFYSQIELWETIKGRGTCKEEARELAGRNFKSTMLQDSRLSFWLSVLAHVMILGSWERALCQVPTQRKSA